jgi:DNA-directed RNA polymerase subunit RPC12/RpoP
MKCPKCNAEMYGVSSMTLGDPKFKHYMQCPECNYKTKAK